MKTSLWILPAAILTCASTMSCVARVHPVVVDATYEYSDAPVNVETYPSVYYEGQPHYYVEGRWYRKTGRGWGYYRQEPSELSRRRPVVQQAPPAHRGVYQAPPAQRGVYEAPPAPR